MSAPESSRPAPEDKARWKFAVLHTIDEKLAGVLAAARPAAAAAPVPAPAPSPGMSLEAWAALFVRMSGRSDEEKLQVLREQNLTPEAWAPIDEEYRRMLSDDVLAGRQERPAIFVAVKRKEDKARLAEGQCPPAEDDAGASCAPPARPHAVGACTNDVPDLGSAAFAEMGRAPFRERPVAPEKRSAKTTKCPALPLAGQTMGLGEGPGQVHFKMIAAVPFPGATGSPGVVLFPELTAAQYVSLRGELGSRADLREEILGRYGVPTEASFGALEEHWRRPELRAARAAATVAYMGWMYEVVTG